MPRCPGTLACSGAGLPDHTTAQMNDHPTPTFQIRVATPADANQIAKLFFDTVHYVNNRDYAPHQIAAWAPTIRPAAD